MLSSLLDRTLDASVVAGYSRVGHAVRRLGWDPLPRLEGRTVLVSGATSGLGRATAERCSDLGASVLLLVRDERKGARVRNEIAAATGNDAVEVVRCDLASLQSVREAAAAVGPLDVLVNNAGVMAPGRTLTEDGLELTFAVNVAGTFLLTQLLADRVGRVVTVSSGGMYARALDVDDLQAERGDYSPPAVYARTKRAQVVLTQEWARRGLDAHAMHPGWAATPGVTESLPRFARVMGPLLRTPEQGADTAVWLTSADVPAGEFWHDRARRPVDRVPWTRTSPADAARLWDAVTALAGAGR